MKCWKHWRDVKKNEWRWKHFSPEELACRGTGKLCIDEPALDRLEALRVRLGKPIIVNSAYRSSEHNKAVGGASRSQHLQAKAFDCRQDNQNPGEFLAAARAVGFTGFGHYPKHGFIHVDTGPARKWNSGGWYQEAKARTLEPTPQFRPEPKKESPIESLTKPEVLGPALGPVLPALPALTSGNGPVQWAVGAALFIGVCAAIFFFVRRQQKTGLGD